MEQPWKGFVILMGDFSIRGKSASERYGPQEKSFPAAFLVDLEVLFYVFDTGFPFDFLL